MNTLKNNTNICNIINTFGKHKTHAPCTIMHIVNCTPLVRNHTHTQPDNHILNLPVCLTALLQPCHIYKQSCVCACIYRHTYTHEHKPHTHTHTHTHSHSRDKASHSEDSNVCDNNEVASLVKKRK